MEVALRRRLEGVAEIRISQARQTAEVGFSPGPHTFSAAEFRAAVQEADVDVLRFEIEACGRVVHEGAAILFLAGHNRFTVTDEPTPESGETCLAADLDDGTTPGRLRRVRLLTESH